MVSIKLNIEGEREVMVDDKSTYYDIIKSKDSKLAKKALAVNVNGIKKDLYEKPVEGDKVDV
ncbi:MAG: hypothetical protein WDA32_08770, partial [Candidatus Caldatribacteriota bacterium]